MLQIDKVLTGKYTAIPSFIAIMGLVFWLTFSVIGKGLSDLLNLGISKLTDLVDILAYKSKYKRGFTFTHN